MRILDEPGAESIRDAHVRNAHRRCGGAVDPQVRLPRLTGRIDQENVDDGSKMLPVLRLDSIGTGLRHAVPDLPSGPVRRGWGHAAALAHIQPQTIPSEP